MSVYSNLIMEATGCSAAEAPAVEEVMRVVSPTLDSLSRPSLKRLAKQAYAVVRS